jgi:hypothetical protein
VGTKNNPGRFDCYKNAEPDEPIFILLGRDPHAHVAVRKWALDRLKMIDDGLKPETDMEMIWEALDCAAKMQLYTKTWRDRKQGKL